METQPSLRFEEFVRSEHEIDMDQRGYFEITCASKPDEALLSIGGEMLSSLAASSDTVKNLSSTDYPVEIKEQWQTFMLHGINLEVNLLSHFGCTQGVIRQGPIICDLARPPGGGGPRRAHPCRGAISIWRPMCNTGREISLLTVYPGSHHLRTTEDLRESQISPVNIRILSNQVLVTHGDLWIEECRGDGLVVWMGLSMEIIGLHIDMHCLAFIALAYGATQFLSRQEPAVTQEAQQYLPPPLLRQIMPNSRLQHSRFETANGILAQAMQDHSRLVAFFEELQDPTGLILQAEYHTANDPREAFLTTGRHFDPAQSFKRVLTVRRHAQRFYTRDISIAKFIAEEGLPNTAQMNNAIRHGQKMYWVELDIRKPGIWLVLMTVLARFDHLPVSEVSMIPSLLREKYRETILSAASNLSGHMNSSSRLYDTWIDLLLDVGDRT